MTIVFSTRQVYRILRISSIAALVCFGARHLPAQPFGASSQPVQGRIHFEGSATTGQFIVRLNGAGSHEAAVTAYVLPDGSFEMILPNTAQSHYRLSVLDAIHRNVVHSEIVDMHLRAVPLDIWVREKPRGSEPVTGVVSVRELVRKTPKGAKKEFARGQKAVRAGEADKSIEHFQNALEIFPSYVQARAELAAAYLRADRPEEAADESRRAIETDPSHAYSHFCLAMALRSMKEYSEAESEARQAVRLNPLSPWGHWLLGTILLDQGKRGADALESMRRAAPEIAPARLALARLLAERGQLREAAAQVESYLASGEERNRDAARRWLRQLKVENK